MKRNRNREALRALQKDPEPDGKSGVPGAVSAPTRPAALTGSPKGRGTAAWPGRKTSLTKGFSFSSSPCAEKAMVCFGNMFIELPKPQTKEMLQKGKAGCPTGSAHL